MMTRIHRAIVAAVLVLLAITGSALAEPPIPALTGRVVDEAGILDAATINELIQRLAAYETSSGNQVVVVTLPDLKGYTIEDWGLALGRGWGVGQKGKNNGVLLIVAPNDRQLRIEVGYGLEGNLPDATAHAIIQNEIIPRFKGGDMKGGVVAGVAAILGSLAGTYKGPLSAGYGGTGSDGGFWIFAPFIVFPTIFFSFVGIILLFRTGSSGFGSFSRGSYDDDSPSRSSFSGGGSSGGFSGGGGSFGGGGASGRW